MTNVEKNISAAASLMAAGYITGIDRRTADVEAGGRVAILKLILPELVWKMTEAGHLDDQGFLTEDGIENVLDLVAQLPLSGRGEVLKWNFILRNTPICDF